MLRTIKLIVSAVRRRKPPPVHDWTEDAYAPTRTEQPRAITRITSSDLEWEITT